MLCFLPLPLMLLLPLYLAPGKAHRFSEGETYKCALTKYFEEDTAPITPTFSAKIIRDVTHTKRQKHGQR
jgi:hypothetical protein